MMLDDFAEGYLGIFGDARQSDMEVRDTLRSIEESKEGAHYWPEERWFFEADDEEENDGDN